MELRSMFKNIFGVKTQKETQHQRLKMLNDYMPTFYSQKVEDSYVVKTVINRIATHASKFEMVHKQYQKDNIREVNGDINYLLQHRPNPITSPSQFLYRVVSNLYTYGNSFVYIAKDKEGMITGFYPVNAQKYELLEDKTGTIYIRFTFIQGQVYEMPYNELIHLRNMYDEKDIFGSPNDYLKEPIETNNTAMQGIQNAIKATSALRGLIKYTNGILKESDMKKFKEQFVSDYLNLENESGIAMLDAKADFIPIKIDPITLSNTQLELLDNAIYRAFGMDSKILNSSYTETEWSAFYESVLEPLALQMEQEFTYKVFSNQSIKNGHRIMFVIEKLKYCKTTTKISLISQIGQLGILTVDECRRILDLAPFGGEKGERTLQTLNVVNSDLADNYQLGENNDKEEEQNERD